MLIALSVAAAVFSLGVFVTPELLIKLGIMDMSLQSDIELVRRVALIEVELIRWASMALGVLIALVALRWDAISSSERYRAFMSKSREYPPSYEKILPRIVTKETIFFVSFMALSVLYLILGDTLFSLEVRVWINKEDGIIETASAILLLVASVLCAVVAFSGKPSGVVRAMHAFLCVLFFVMAGEEVSWAQRFFAIETPEALRKINVQQELNFHNLFGYFFDHLFILCFFLWGCIVPLIDRWSKVGKNLFRAVGLPIPSAGLALCMFAATLTQVRTLDLLGLGVEGLRPAELREFLSAVAFVALASQSLRGFVHFPKARGAVSRALMPGE